MNGMLNIVMVIATLLVAGMTYQIKFKARTLELDIHVLQKKNETIKSNLSVLRAEKAYLSRPERIERLAAKFLSFSPIQKNQSLTEEILQAGRLEVESEESALLALKAMQETDRTRALDKNSDAKAGQSVSVWDRQNSKPARANRSLQRTGQHKSQPASPLGRHQGRVMGYVSHEKEKSLLESLNAEPIAPKSVRSKPAAPKPKWTYFGSMGDDE